MSQERGSVADLIERVERDYLLRSTTAKMRSPVDSLDVGDFHLEHLSAGEGVEVPRWVADELVGQGMAEASETPFENEIFSSLSKEKMMGPLQLSGLPADFYVRMRRRLAAMSNGLAEGKTRKEDYDRLRAVCYDLVGIRLSKLLSLSSSSAPSSTLGEKLTPEESAFFALSQSLSKEWKTVLLGSSK